MGVPKRRMSKSKIRSRRSAHSREIILVTACTQCSTLRRPHHVCPSCGYYNGRQVVSTGD